MVSVIEETDAGAEASVLPNNLFQSFLIMSCRYWSCLDEQDRVLANRFRTG